MGGNKKTQAPKTTKPSAAKHAQPTEGETVNQVATAVL